MRVLPAVVLLATVAACNSGEDGKNGPVGPGVGSSSDCGTGTHGVPSEMRRIALSQYGNVIEDVMGVPGGKSYPGGYGESATGFSTESALNAVGEQTVEKIMNAAEEVALSLPKQLNKLLPCASDGDEACAQTYLDTVGRRLFRRTLTAEERDALLATFDAEVADEASFEDALSVMTAQMLQMPAFLYVVEAPSEAGKDRARTGLELASRLSFHLWNSAPDDELLNAAEGDELTTKDAVKAQAERLLADPRSDRGFVRFFREWTGTEPVTLTNKDSAVFDYLDQDFADSFNASFDRFVVDQVRSDGTLYGLLRSPDVIVDANMAAFFALPDVSDWTKVTLDGTRYTGIMTQPGMLAALSHSTDPSYVYRGRFIRKRLLCQPIGAPPATAMAEFAKIELPEDPTAREVSSAVQSRAGCGGCHGLIDPGGLALEHFDAMGDYQEEYASGKAIETAGSLTSVSVENDVPLEFAGPVDMMEGLAQLPETQACFALQIYRYTASRIEAEADACAVKQIQDSMAASDNQLKQAFLAATQTDAFMYRRGE